MRSILVILLSVALLVAVGVLVFGVGRIIYGIAHYYLRERKPIRKFQHPRLGALSTDESDNTLWTGLAKGEGREIHFLLSGSKVAPSEQSVAQLERIMARYAELESQAIKFLRDKESEIRDAKLDLYLLNVSDEQHPEKFTFEFTANTLDDRIWRVEYLGGEPKQTGFDD